MPLPFLKFFVSVDEKNGCRTSNNQIALNMHTDFAEGLKQTIDWYVANESWWRPSKEATEARYRSQGQ